MKLFSNKNFYYIKVIAIIIAFTFLIQHAWAEFALSIIWITPIYLIVGFYFGKLTCSLHSKRAGFWVTLIIFGLLNLFHSLLDGIALIGITGVYRNIAIYSHELIRQPAMYIVFWAMLQPFKIHPIFKGIASLFVITGIWILGMDLGMISGVGIYQYESIHPFLVMSIFIFMGDIIHHLYDEYPKRTAHIH